MAEETRSGANTTPHNPGPFLAKIVSHLDPSYMGTLEVELLHEVGNDEGREGQIYTVKYLNPFYGVTNISHVGRDPDDHNNTQKAYGMWMVPPDVGTIVMVMFVEGDVRKGFWMGCVQDENMNFSVPGYAATKHVVSDTRKSKTENERVPVSEYNKVVHQITQDPTKINKPEHPTALALEKQGLLKDDTRGITTSSARREVPSMVFGISTPGPVDKAGKTGKVGTYEHQVPDAFVSRLGGSSFVMDDGDDKFLRKKTPSEGPPDYASVEAGETDGLKNVPHNELIRFRTRTGHQILLHNSEDLIYIGNSRGTAWIELTSDGKIDVYAEDSVSIRTKKDFNFYADRDINMEAGRNFNLKVAGRHQTEVGGNMNLIVTGNGTIKVSGNYDRNVTGNNNMTAGGATNIKSGGNHIETAAQIHMNGPAAATAAAPTALPTHTNPNEKGEMTTSIMKRVPSFEPWPHHENLEPTKVKPELTDREVTTTIPVPEHWKKYSTKTDTFEKVLPTNQEEANAAQPEQGSGTAPAASSTSARKTSPTAWVSRTRGGR